MLTIILTAIFLSLFGRNLPRIIRSADGKITDVVITQIAQELPPPAPIVTTNGHAHP